MLKFWYGEKINRALTRMQNRSFNEVGIWKMNDI